MSYVFRKRSPAAERGRERANRKSVVLPVRYDSAAVGVRRMTKDIPRLQFQQRDIAKSFFGDRKPGPPPGPDLVVPKDDRRQARIGMRRASCSLNNNTILIQQAEPWEFDINRAPQIGWGASVVHRFANDAGGWMRRKQGVSAASLPQPCRISLAKA
jgi:hypothetical protein